MVETIAIIFLQSDQSTVLESRDQVILTVALILQCCVRLSSLTYVLWLNGVS